MNWVDLVIIAILIFFVIESFRVGFLVIFADFLSFLFSLLIALRGYQVTSNFLRSNFVISRSVSNALGFLLTAILTETILGFIFAKVLTKLPKKIWQNKFNKWLAIIPAVGEGIVLIAFVITLVIGFPVSPKLKGDISTSKLGSLILKSTTGVETKLGEIFGGVIEDSLTYLTIKPKSDEKVDLDVDKLDLSVDSQAEGELFILVNQERKKQGLHELVWDPEIVPVARSHAQDMWERKYFAHVSPDGKDVGDRLTEAGINYLIAGENLALAPTVQTAHTGLMNSEGHRANILGKDFRKMGIGVIENGYYGKMFVQVFTN